MKAFNLRFMKIFNEILEVIQPSQEVYLVKYYIILSPTHRNQLEEKNVTNLGLALQNCIEFEDQNQRTSLLLDQSSSKTDMKTMLQMMQYMHNHMIAFEHRIVTNPKPTPTPPLRLLTKPDSTQSRETSACHWCNFCYESHDPFTCNPFLLTK